VTGRNIVHQIYPYWYNNFGLMDKDLWIIKHDDDDDDDDDDNNNNNTKIFKIAKNTKIWVH